MWQPRFIELAVLIALLSAAPVARAESPLKSGADFVSRLKADPAGVNVALATARGNAFHIAAALVAKSTGVDPKKLLVVTYTSSGQAVNAALRAEIAALRAELRAAR